MGTFPPLPLSTPYRRYVKGGKLLAKLPVTERLHYSEEGHQLPTTYTVTIGRDADAFLIYDEEENCLAKVDTDGCIFFSMGVGDWLFDRLGQPHGSVKAALSKLSRK